MITSEKIQIIPTIESKVFKDHPESRFAVGEVAVNNTIVNGYDNEFFGAAQLRVNTYLSRGFVRSDELNDAGTELDHNDERSAHFVVLEQATASLARVVGNMRLVVKSPEDPSLLPMESYFPEIYSENPLFLGSVEVSRLIARHEDPKVQNFLKWPLFVSGYKYVDSKDLGPVYGLLSPALIRHLRMQHVPVSAIAAEKYVQEINATKQPAEVNLPLLKRVIDISGDLGIDVKNGGFSYLNLPIDVDAEEDI
jgi:N-acyl-L-homoserine lactone synthetase